MMVGSTLVCIWTSVVNVPSLGLLLGRDFLDAIGAVLSFSRRILRADHLDGSHIRLRQLMAGHFALQLLPSCWPAPGAQKWRKLGVDGVLECQVSGSEWLKRRLQACRISSKPSHEHLITEHAEKMADISMSGMKVQDSIADMARDSPTSFNSRDTYSSQKASFFVRTNGNGTRRMPSKMGTNGQTFLRPSSMARLRPSALALAATVVALCAIPISFGWESRSMGASSGSHGHQPFYVKEAPHPSTSTQSLYGPESPRSASASRQNWMGTLIRGRSDVGRNAVGKTLQTSDCEAQGGSSGRVQTRGRANPSEGSVGGSSSQHPWSSRRSSLSLKADLVKLCHVLDVEVDPKDTVEVLKGKIKPMIAIMKLDGRPPAKAKSSATAQASSPASPKQKPTSPSTDSHWSYPSSPEKETVTPEVLNNLMSQQEARFQSMLQQTMHHVMYAVQTGQPFLGQAEDTPMEPETGS